MADTLHPCCFKSRMFIKSSRLSIGLLGQAQRISPLGIFRPALLGNFQPAEVGNFQSAFLGNSRPALTVTIATVPKDAPSECIYLFSEGPRHLYVGRTRHLRQR